MDCQDEDDDMWKYYTENVDPNIGFITLERETPKTPVGFEWQPTNKIHLKEDFDLEAKKGFDYDVKNHCWESDLPKKKHNPKQSGYVWREKKTKCNLRARDQIFQMDWN